MANGAALIRESLWHDRDFRVLPRTAQCLYLQLLSQKDLDCAGVLTLNTEVLTKGCDEMGRADLESDLKSLAEHRFIVVDNDSDEVLIRSYIRLVSVKSPKVWVAAKTAAKRSRSSAIRQMLASELLRLGRADATELANILTAGGYPIDTVSEHHQYPIDTRYPIDTVSIPPVPVTVPVLESPTVGGWVGRAADAATPCPKHPDGPNHGEPCKQCQRNREHAEATKAAETTARAETLRTFWADVADCQACDPKGWLEDMSRCPHHDWEELNGLRR